MALDESLVALERAPLQLIVPDGTWRQASKMHLRHPELRNVPRLKIGVTGDSTFQMRTQTRPEGMATLQAVAHALGVIEGDSVRRQLMKLYYAKMERILIARGILREALPQRS